MTEVNAKLLWQCIAWVEWRHVTDPASAENSRLQRPYRVDDGKILGSLIKKVRAKYHAEKNLHGKLANFQNCKDSILKAEKITHDWSEATRNFYSSIISTYISWNYRGIPEEDKDLICQVAAYKSYTTDTPALI